MRVLMWISLGVTVACALGAYAYGSWIFPAAVIVFSLALLLLVLTYWYPKLKIVAVILFGLSIGFGVFSIQDYTLLVNARNLSGQNMTVTIEAQDYSYATEYGAAFDGKLLLDGETFQVRAYLDENPRLEPGDRVTGCFRLSFTIGESAYYPADGIFLVAYPQDDVVIKKFYEPLWYHYPAIWRHNLEDRIDDSFPEDTAGFAKALLLGDRTGIDYETNTAFKLSGISHIIAVSGLHVSILFGLIYFVTLKRRFLTALIGIPCVIIFAAIAGFSPSVTRASIMQCLVMLALLFDREYDPLTALGFSALVMQMVNPYVVTSISFQLSMGCMLGIFLFSERIRGWLIDSKRLGRYKGKITRWFAGSVSVTLSAMVFTTPLVAYYFGAVSLVSVLTNLLTLWVVTFIFYGIMAVCLLGFVSAFAGSVVGWIISWLIRYVLTVSKVLASFPLAAVYTESIYIVIWLVAAYLLLGLFMMCNRKQPVLFTSLVIASLAIAIGLSWLEPMLWKTYVTVLDVGQGQSVILQSSGKTYLVDCGGDYDEDAADKAADTLLSRGIGRIDGLILTHLDRDHAGGVEYLLKRIGVDAIYLPKVIDKEGSGDKFVSRYPNACVVDEDICLTNEGINLSVFAPESYNSGNESSLCILFQTENCDILIPGDRGFAAERLLLKDHSLPKLELLVVGHHGSKYSTSEELLAATRPEYAFISAGKDNRFGHPAKETLDRLTNWGVVTLCTAQEGNIIFRR